MRRRHFIWLGVLALSVPLLAAAVRADVTVRATLSSQRVQVGEPVTLAIDINGAQDVPAPPITADGFDARYVGPSTQISIVNGHMNSSVQHHYSLLPLQPGRFTVGPFSLDYNGQHYQTASFTVEVVDAPQAPQAPAPSGQAPRGQAPQGQAAQQPAPPGQAPAPQEASAPPAAAAAGTFQADAENVFRQNPILGPKVGRIEWSGAETAKVYLRDFPIDQMPPEMKTMFADRMKGRIKEKKEAHQVTATAKFDLVDEATGKVLDTITE